MNHLYVTIQMKVIEQYFKVHLTPKYFFAWINPCTCSKRAAPFFKLNLDFLWAVKVKKI